MKPELRVGTVFVGPAAGAAVATSLLASSRDQVSFLASSRPVTKRSSTAGLLAASGVGPKLMSPMRTAGTRVPRPPKPAPAPRP